MTYVKIDGEGRLSVHNDPIPTGERERLAFLQKAVGGYIEPVHLPDDIVAWLDEDGMPRELPVNMIASAVIWNLSGRVGQTYVGPAVFTGYREVGEGLETVDLTPDQVTMIGKAAGL